MVTGVDYRGRQPTGNREQTASKAMSQMFDPVFSVNNYPFLYGDLGNHCHYFDYGEF